MMNLEKATMMALKPLAAAHDALVRSGLRRPDDWRVVICQGDRGEQAVIDFEDLRLAKLTFEAWKQRLSSERA